MAEILALDALRVGYGQHTVIGPVSASLGPGLYHLVGGNGSGKTTLMRSMCGELRPIDGRCEVLGRSIWHEPESRAQLAYVSATPEQPEFLSVEECWRLYAALRGQPKWDGYSWQRRLGLEGDWRLSRCSAGQRRRAEFLAALAADPKVLLLDELWANLDDESIDVILESLERWRAERVILMTSHRELPLKADAVFTLSAGALRWEV